MADDLVSVRSMVNDVQESIDFFVVEDVEREVQRLREAGVPFRNEIVTGPGGRQILIDHPSGNPIELFQPAGS